MKKIVRRIKKIIYRFNTRHIIKALDRVDATYNQCCQRLQKAIDEKEKSMQRQDLVNDSEPVFQVFGLIYKTLIPIEERNIERLKEIITMLSLLKRKKRLLDVIKAHKRLA